MMTPDPITLPYTALLVDGAATMREAGIGAVVVLDGGTVCGIATGRDIMARARPRWATSAAETSRRCRPKIYSERRSV